MLGSYIFTAIFSFLELKDYKRNILYEDDTPVIKSTNVPSVSIIAPAYNEVATVVENVRSLLTLNYPEYEIIIINDGSTDRTLQRLIKTFEMEKDPNDYHNFIPTQPIKDVYISRNRAYRNLRVVDKENGGKADALNAGINVCDNELICNIDVDCVLENDALLKLARPFLNNKTKVIASGGIIRVANSCVIVDGKMVKVNLPDRFLPKAQILEYFRAFLMGRMAWSRLDGLLLISGAFGMFDKEMVVESGGYDINTVGEDMELLVRMRRIMQERDEDYMVGFIPDPLCWTEVPQTWNVLHRQRNRWARGTVESLYKHRGMLFNPRYRILGLLSMPYWLFFEWLAPLVEFVGLIFLLFMILVGGISWLTFLSFFLVVSSISPASRNLRNSLRILALRIKSSSDSG